MKRWLSLDPGTRRTGWAYWNDERLVEWGLVTAKDIATTSWWLRSRLMANRVYDLVERLDPAFVLSEFPQEMAGGRGAVALASGAVRKLAAYVGMLEGRLAAMDVRLEIVEPMTWKGQVPKPITEKRVRRDYPQLPEGLWHDTVDAIGIGRWFLKQERKRSG
jgi:hypothetical protein